MRKPTTNNGFYRCAGVRTTGEAGRTNCAAVRTNHEVVRNNPEGIRVAAKQLLPKLKVLSLELAIYYILFAGALR